MANSSNAVKIPIDSWNNVSFFEIMAQELKNK